MLIMFLLIALIPAQVRAEEDTTRYSFGHFYYHSHNGYVSICGYLGRETEVEIPSVMSGRPVSEIESGSFQGCNTIETITVPDIAVPTNTEPGNEDAPEIGDYVYEETDEETDTGSDNASSDTTPNLPDGIHIPDSDIVVTVDENDNLVQADSKGNKIVLDSEKKYQMEENEDGSVKIVDADGKEVKVTDEGNVLFGDIDEEEVVDNEGKRPIILWVAVILGIAVVAVAAGFVVKKKMKKK